MDIARLSLPSAAVRPVPPVRAASARPETAAGAGERRPPVEAPPPMVGVEVSRRSDGVQRLTFVDLRTGVVICQTPPEQVLRVVDSIVEAIQRREGSDGQHER